MTGGTLKRIGTPRQAKPGKGQQANVTVTRICSVCHQPRQVRYGKFVQHQRARDDRGLAIVPVDCAGGGLTAPKRNVGGLDVGRGER